MNAIKFQFITHFTERYSYFDSARLALEGGCRWIQLRMALISPAAEPYLEVMAQLSRQYTLQRFGKTISMPGYADSCSHLHITQ